MDEQSERIAKRFERPLIVAAVLTIPVTILQLLPPPDPWLMMADVLNWLIWFAFLAEVVVMLAVVPSRPAWLRGHPIEVAIVLLTCPVLATVIQSVRVLRLVRLLRFLRLAPPSGSSSPLKESGTRRSSRCSQPSPEASPSHRSRTSRPGTASTGRSPP